MFAKERLWRTADGKRIVGEGHLDARRLVAAVGRVVPVEDRRMVKDGMAFTDEERKTLPDEPAKKEEAGKSETKEDTDVKDKGVKVNRGGGKKQ